MKKILIITLSLLTGLLYFNAFYENSRNERSRYANLIQALNQLNHPVSAYIFDVQNLDDPAQAMNDLTYILNETGTTAVSQQFAADGADGYFSYIFVPDPIQEQIHLKNGAVLSQNLLEKGCITSDLNDQNAAGYIDFTNADDNRSGNSLFIIASLTSARFTGNLKNQGQFYLEAAAEDQGALKKRLESLPIPLLEATPVQNSTVPSDEESLNPLILMILAVNIVFMLYYILQKRNTIHILHQQGLYSYEIFGRLFLKTFLWLLALPAAETAVLFLWTAGLPRPANLELLSSCFRLVAALGVLTAVLFCTAWLAISAQSRVPDRNQRTSSASWLPVLLVLHTLLLVFLIPQLSGSFQDAWRTGTTLSALHRNREQFASWLTMNSIPPLSQEQTEVLDAFLIRQHVVYQAIRYQSDGLPHDELPATEAAGLLFSSDVQLMLVNENYMNLEEVRFALPKNESDALSPNTVLYPKRLLSSVTGTLNSGWKEVVYSDGINFPVLYAKAQTLSLMDPVIIICRNWTPGSHPPSMGEGRYFLSAQNWTLEELSQALKNEGIEDTWVSQEAFYTRRTNLVRYEFQLACFLFGISLLLCAVLMYCFLKMYLISQTRALALRAAAGVTPIYEICRLIPALTTAILAAVLTAWIRLKQPILPLMVTGALVLTAETLWFARLYDRWACHELTTILRNEL